MREVGWAERWPEEVRKALPQAGELAAERVGAGRSGGLRRGSDGAGGKEAVTGKSVAVGVGVGGWGRGGGWALCLRPVEAGAQHNYQMG